MSAVLPVAPLSTRPITEAEQRVLEWMYFGKTNDEIASVLGVSRFTVKNHVQALCRKLGVENRTRVVTYALERGLLHLKGQHDYIRHAAAMRRKGSTT